MRKNLLLAFILSCLCTITVFAQWPYMTAIPNGPNKKAIITEQVGLTDVTITYHRPAVNGREGKIWGDLVPKGFTKAGFGTNNPSPWRAGANENTIIEFNNDIKVEGQSLPKGKYALFIAYDASECIIVFSRKYDGWGSYFYDEKDDVLRVKVRPYTLTQSVEWLRYEFTSQTVNSAVVALEWEKLAIPFRIEVDYLQQQFDAISAEVKNPRGFTWESYNKAATWSLENNYQLEQGLAWARLSSDSNQFGGDRFFSALSIKAQLLEKLGRKEEAANVMRQAAPLATMIDLHQYGRRLMAQKMSKEALEVFRANYKKYPKEFTTMVGMVRGLSANGDYKQATEIAKRALAIAPNEANKKAVEDMIVKLKEGKDVN